MRLEPARPHVLAERCDAGGIFLDARCDERPRTVAAVQQPCLDQVVDCLPHRDTRHAERLCDFALGQQRFIGRKHLPLDRLSQARLELDVECPMATCSQRTDTSNERVHSLDGATPSIGRSLCNTNSKLALSRVLGVCREREVVPDAAQQADGVRHGVWTTRPPPAADSGRQPQQSQAKSCPCVSRMSVGIREYASVPISSLHLDAHCTPHGQSHEGWSGASISQKSPMVRLVGRRAVRSAAGRSR